MSDERMRLFRLRLTSPREWVIQSLEQLGLKVVHASAVHRGFMFRPSAPSDLFVAVGLLFERDDTRVRGGIVGRRRSVARVLDALYQHGVEQDEIGFRKESYGWNSDFPVDEDD